MSSSLSFPISLPIFFSCGFVVVVFVFLSYPNHYEMVTHNSFNLHFPSDNDSEHVFICLWGIYIFKEIPIQILWVVLGFVVSLKFIAFKHLIMILVYFLQFCGLSFPFVMVSINLVVCSFTFYILIFNLILTKYLYML